ncbi:tRNA (adenosine(37)-N6)-threonylcarbamoyltransferase complex ATPase subunit type 1 TsaE [Lacunimicrobium album]
MTKLEILTQNLQETDDLARRVANASFPGLVVCLTGNLGAGKTRFSKAFCTALGVPEEEVNSPTFVLIQEYLGRWPEKHGASPLTIYHFDTYRLKDLDEFCELGAEEMLSGNGICLLEWGERVAEMLPADTLYITIEATSETSRRFTFRGDGEQISDLIEQLSIAQQQ